MRPIGPEEIPALIQDVPLGLCGICEVNSIEGPQGGTPPPPNLGQAF